MRKNFRILLISLMMTAFLSLFTSCYSLFHPGSMEVGEGKEASLRYYRLHYEHRESGTSTEDLEAAGSSIDSGTHVAGSSLPSTEPAD